MLFTAGLQTADSFDSFLLLLLTTTKVSGVTGDQSNHQNPFKSEKKKKLLMFFLFIWIVKWWKRQFDFCVRYEMISFITTGKIISRGYSG